VHEFPAENNMASFHPLYSSDLVPCDFTPFPKLKMVLKARSFNNVTMIQAKSLDAPAEYRTTDFKECFKWLQDHWACCIRSQGDYFEGAHIL
jgi:hypothetical protein